MPFYRIIIYTKDKKPMTGIRQYEASNIETVHLMCQQKAKAFFGRNFQDIEVQMLSKISTTVRKHLASLNKKRADKHWQKPSLRAPLTNIIKPAEPDFNWGQYSLKQNEEKSNH